MRLIVLFFILLLSGCTLSTHSLMLVPDTEGATPQKLQHIRIERWGDIRFDGILALRVTSTGLHYALIDATGVKLLQAWSDGGGEHDAVKPTGPLATKGLAPFLSEAIARIYLVNPAQRPCSRKGFLSVCITDSTDSANGTGGLMKKSGSFAGIPYWHVEGELNSAKKRSRATGIETRYSQPWLGVEIVLQDFSGQE